jgi:hypothetical protein
VVGHIPIEAPGEIEALENKVHGHVRLSGSGL